ncbi:hypothetical protein VP01_245g5 [Puccinia sorghi]|uniref:Uncharacterized protein n=1 Tax=Puccinia sorghi TaxID=27349 RepID=A0A0L6V612_9BASI|nr:hypothetical protein VP01_245g5 [Puccinia sorghi]
MRHSFIYSVLHLSTFTFFTAATPPGWNEAQSKTCLPFDLNVLPAEEIPPESLSSSDVPIASSPAMDKLIAPSRFTSEGLAANNHVLSGLRGPPSADGESASIHGCDHKGKLLAQQSSSNGFSSTSAGKRKTSDSSSVSTSQRYQKDNTSYRYEPSNVSNQHFPLKISVSDMIPTSSKPGYVLLTEKNPTREEIRKLKEKEVAVLSGLETKKEAGILFHVYDWNFLREYPERGKPDDDQHQFLRHLNRCKGESDVESFFFIQRDRASKFMYHFLSRKRLFEFNFPPNIPKGRRLGMLFETLVRLSDKKINLDSNHYFENQIIGGMRERLAANFENTQNPSSPNIKTIMRFVQDVTKVTQLLIVAHLSLFKEHEQQVLTSEEVEKHLEFLKNLWFQIDEGTPQMQKRDWAMKAHKVFRFQDQANHFCFMVTRKDRNYSFCWNLVNHWREKTERSLGGFSGEEILPSKFQELFNKLIFFSNHEA